MSKPPCFQPALGGYCAPSAKAAAWPKGARLRCDDRLALAGIIIVLRFGIPWKMMPREFGCSGMTCCGLAPR